MTKDWFLIGSQVHVRLICWKQGRIVRKPVNANPSLKVIQFITFSSTHFVLLLCFVYMVVIKTKKNAIYRKPQPQSYKNQIKIPRTGTMGWYCPSAGTQPSRVEIENEQFSCFRNIYYSFETFFTDASKTQTARLLTINLGNRKWNVVQTVNETLVVWEVEEKENRMSFRMC